jgi:hypothetical protein
VILPAVSSGEFMRFEIEIRASGPAIAGRWWSPGERPRPFTGWTELFAALDAAISDRRRGNDAKEGASAETNPQQVEE